MAKCKDCIHFPICKPHTDPNESYPEVGGCPAFKSKDAFVEIVRCKDCKYYKQKTSAVDYLPAMCCVNNKAIWTYTPPDAFCSYGERREGE